LKDADPFRGENYYRLRIIDLDGSYEFSKTLSFAGDQDSGIRLKGNLVQTELILENVDHRYPPQYKVLDSSGRLIIKGAYFSNSIDIGGLNRGSYILRVETPLEIRAFRFQKF